VNMATACFLRNVGNNLTARIVEPAETAVARERLCKQTPVAKQWLGDRHMIAATSQPATMEELLEAVISMWSASFCMRSSRARNPRRKHIHRAVRVH
jgi:hypothetical protein